MLSQDMPERENRTGQVKIQGERKKTAQKNFDLASTSVILPTHPVCLSCGHAPSVVSSKK